MLENFDHLLEKYARLLIQKGVQIKKGDNLMLYIDTNQAKFAELLTREAYAVGARRVYVTWNNTALSRLDLENAATDVLAAVPQWQKDKIAYLIDEEKIARLSIISEDPNALDGLDPEKLQVIQKARSLAFKKQMDATMKNEVKWSIGAVASYEWAKHIFPEAASDPEKCVDLLWDQIFTICRVYADDPVAAWDAHRDNLDKHAAFLNEQAFSALHYTAPGTDLTIGLPKGHIWTSAESISASGDTFIANMPTEEVFTAPDTRRIDGVVTSTKPLAYNGNLIEGIRAEYKDGELISIDAEKGGEIMRQLAFENDGGKGLGEVALVPYESPISLSNLTFYTTLFDENASNHIAIGAAYPFTVKDTEGKTDDQLREMGLNISNVHVDFMIGSDKMDIDGIKEDGEIVPVFRQGAWAFEV